MNIYCSFIILCVMKLYFTVGQRLVSPNKTITSSSTHKTWGPEYAVDGNLRRDLDSCNCCAVTNPDDLPWIKLDLGEIFLIERIELLGRIDSFHNFDQMSIILGKTASDGTTIVTVDSAVQTFNYTLESPQQGLYVTLELGRKDYFVVCELSVYAVCDGWYGQNCATPCGQCFGNAVCDKVTGICPGDNCAGGYQGNKCDKACNEGRYGESCSQTCGKCDNNAICNHTDGTCTACETGYLSPLCKVCADRWYGKNCDVPCGHCLGDVACDKTTGNCPGGNCAAGYQGTNCDQVAKDDQTDSPVLSILGAAVGVLAILFILSVAFNIFQTRRISKLRKKLDTKQHETGNHGNGHNDKPGEIRHIHHDITQYEELHRDQIQIEIPNLDYETLNQDKVHYENN